MRAFVLHLASAVRYERIDGVESFVAADASGEFGLLAGHDRFVTALVPGLARFRRRGEDWQYLALPGGTAYFAAGELRVATSRYARGTDYHAMRAALHERLGAEEARGRELRLAVRRLEEQMLRRLYELERTEAR